MTYEFDYEHARQERRKDRTIWNEVRERHGVLVLMYHYVGVYTQQWEHAKNTVDAVLMDRTEEWLESKDTGYLLDRMDTCIEIINGNPLYIDLFGSGDEDEILSSNPLN